MITRKLWIAGSGLAVGLAFAWGCADRQASSSSATTPPTPVAVVPVEAPPTADVATSIDPSSAEQHGHKPGEHGGIIVSLGRDNYHAEAVFEKGGVLRLYTLGQDESRVIDVEAQTLRAFVKVEGDSQAESFTLSADPQEGDAEGRTSQFVVQLPQSLSGQNLEVTIPNLVINGERFRLGFQSKSESHETADHMPLKVEDAAERELYLTAGGIYTDADIQANGGVVASEKFKGIPSVHNLDPQAGDRICPVTLTLANPKFSWVVGGKTYQFCCPPCIDEFVRTAKETPGAILAPEEYVQK